MILFLTFIQEIFMGCAAQEYCTSLRSREIFAKQNDQKLVCNEITYMYWPSDFGVMVLSFFSQVSKIGFYQKLKIFFMKKFLNF